MATHPLRCFLQYDGAWQDVTTDVRQTDPVKVALGGGEVSAAPKPSQVSLTFDDRDSVYRPDLATSPLYGKTGRNTPLLLGYDLVEEGFEDAGLDLTISAGSSVNGWARSSTSPHSGSWCYQSGTTAAGAFSDAIIEAPTGATMCVLWYRTDCHADDRLRISTGGVLRESVGGTGGSWTQIAVPIVESSTGNRQVYLRYLKDGATTAGADAVYVDDVLFLDARSVVEVSSWAPDRTVDFDASTGRGDQWTEVVGEGLLRRVGSWTEPLHSAMHRAISGLGTLVGFWPGEDDRNATQMASAIAGTAALASGVTFDEDESPGGGSTSVLLSSTGSLLGRFNTTTTTTGWQISWAFKLAQVPAGGTGLPLMSWTTSNGYRWSIDVNNSSYTINVLDNDGTSLLASPIGFGTGGEPNNWITMRFRASASGGTVTYNLAWYPEGAGVTYTAGSTFSGSVGRLLQWRIGGNTNTADGWFAYVYGVEGTADDLLDGDLTASFNGFPGETAGNRFLRLMREEGLEPDLIGAAEDTELMGVQRPDSLLDLLREIRDTDGGVLFDTRSAIGISYRTRVDMYRQAPALELTFPDDIAPPLRPVLDDLETHNVVTVSQRDGGSATAADNTGPMGTQPSPDGVGVYKQDIDVNVSDEDRLVDLAGWWLQQGTIPDARYPQVTVDLDASPELAAAAGATGPGDRITIEGLAPDLIDLIVVGLAETLTNSKRRRITFTCTPARNFNVGEYDATDSRWDSRTTTLAAPATSSATSLSGERVTVTAMSSAAGSGPYTQTATVTRAVNGVVKALPADSPVHIATPGRWAL
jgi:hypothetical protein